MHGGRSTESIPPCRRRWVRLAVLQRSEAVDWHFQPLSFSSDAEQDKARCSTIFFLMMTDPRWAAGRLSQPETVAGAESGFDSLRLRPKFLSLHQKLLPFFCCPGSSPTLWIGQSLAADDGGGPIRARRLQKSNVSTKDLWKH